MKYVIQWITENQEIVITITRLVLTIGAYLYAAIIHWKSKVKINALEAKDQAAKELLEQLKALKEALERSR